FRILTGVAIGGLPLGDAGTRAGARSALGLPSAAVVVGSFLKDGVGLGEGLEPKLVKGPDTLVETLSSLQNSISELFVLLVGPARGYVRRELERHGIPCRHVQFDSRAELARASHTPDRPLVTSRQARRPTAP